MVIQDPFNTTNEIIERGIKREEGNWWKLARVLEVAAGKCSRPRAAAVGEGAGRGPRSVCAVWAKIKNEVKRASFNSPALLALFSSSVYLPKTFLFRQSASEAQAATFQLTLTIYFPYSSMKLQEGSCFLRPSNPILHCVWALKRGHIVTMLCPCPPGSDDPEDKDKLTKFLLQAGRKNPLGEQNPWYHLQLFSSWTRITKQIKSGNQSWLPVSRT